MALSSSQAEWLAVNFGVGLDAERIDRFAETIRRRGRLADLEKARQLLSDEMDRLEADAAPRTGAVMARINDLKEGLLVRGLDDQSIERELFVPLIARGILEAEAVPIRFSRSKRALTAAVEQIDALCGEPSPRAARDESLVRHIKDFGNYSDGTISLSADAIGMIGPPETVADVIGAVRSVDLEAWRQAGPDEPNDATFQRDRALFGDDLCGALSGRRDRLASLVGKLKDDRLVFAAADRLADLAPEAAVNLFPAAGAAGSLTDFLGRLALAVGRAEEMLGWPDLFLGARRDLWLDELVLRVGWADRRQLVRSVVDALRVIRKAASVARVGQAVQAIGQVGQRAPVAPLAETANRLPRVFSEARIRSAWQVQIEARASARHYRLAHQALDSEACLVKYAVAHAAMRNRHPLAVYVMNACGVSDAVLAEPLAGAAKVAGFLEHLQESRPDLLNSLFSIGDMGLGPATLSPADMYRVLRAFCGDCRDGMDVGFNAVMAGMAAVDDAAGTANRVLRAVDVHDGGQPLTTLCDEAVEGIFAYGSAVEACRIGFATAGRAKDYVSVVAELMRLQGMKFNIKLWVIEAIREGTADAS